MMWMPVQPDAGTGAAFSASFRAKQELAWGGMLRSMSLGGLVAASRVFKSTEQRMPGLLLQYPHCIATVVDWFHRNPNGLSVLQLAEKVGRR